MTKFVAMYLRVSTFDQAHNGYGLGDPGSAVQKIY